MKEFLLLWGCLLLVFSLIIIYIEPAQTEPKQIGYILSERQAEVRAEWQNIVKEMEAGKLEPPLSREQARKEWREYVEGKGDS